MKRTTLLFAALLGIAAVGCDEEPSLEPSLDDVYATAPDACLTYCNDRVDCEWPNLGTVGGEEGEAVKADTKDACVIECAYKAGKGSFYYEESWDGETHTYTVEGRIAGELWAEFLTCLVDGLLFVCVDVDESEDGQHMEFQLANDTAETCDAYNGCVALLGINLEYDWVPEANEGAGACYASGNDRIWGDWEW